MYVLFCTKYETCAFYSIPHVVMGHSTKGEEFGQKNAKNYTTNLDFLNFNFNSEQLTAINHSSRQENLHNNAFVGLL